MDTLAQVILDSFYVDREGFAHLTIPADVSDLVAIDALCRFFEKKNPAIGHSGLVESQLGWYVTHGGVGTRDVSKPRDISFIPVVEGTVEVFRKEQDQVLKSKGLTWVPEIEQALVALAYMCIGESKGSLNEQNMVVPDILNSKSLRGASLTSGVEVTSDAGVRVVPMLNHTPPPFWGASGKRG